MSKHDNILPLPPAVLNHHQITLLPRFRQWMEMKNFPSVLLLTGPAGIGKRNVAYHLAQWLLCHKNQTTFCETPCNSCPSCKRAIQNSWVDFTEILAENENEEPTGSSNSSHALKIEQFRNLKVTLGFGAFENTYKIILIPNAERMTHQAANSLLKILEEPPQGWIFLLTSTDATLLLPTLVSRCQTLRLSPFSQTEILALLADFDLTPENKLLCAELAQGSWIKALSLAQTEDWESRALLFRFLERPQAEINALVDWASQAPHHFEALLDQLEQVTAELLGATLASTSLSENTKWKNQDGCKAILTHAKSVIQSRNGSQALAREFWLKRFESICQSREQLRAPLNRKLLIQDVLLPWLEATSPRP